MTALGDRFCLVYPLPDPRYIWGTAACSSKQAAPAGVTYTVFACHHFGGQKYLEIERYDRIISEDRTKKLGYSYDDDNITIGIPKKVERRHQEDFCQVLGYLAKQKYQADGGPKIRELHNAILEYSAQKATDSYRFIELLMFNYLIGNADAHAKNFALLYASADDRIILAPAYDLLSTDVYPEKIVSHEIAMTVNGKGTYDSITKKDWLTLYEQLGLNPDQAMQEMKRNFIDITAQMISDK